MPKIPEDVILEGQQEIIKYWKTELAKLGYTYFEYNPELEKTTYLDKQRQATKATVQYAVEWFKEKGHNVTCVLDSDEIGFVIREL